MTKKPEFKNLRLVPASPSAPPRDIEIITHFDPGLDPSFFNPQPLQALPAGLVLAGEDGFLHIEQGQRELARYLDQPGPGVPGVPVTIKARIVQVWSTDIEHSYEFRISIDSITTEENP
jgi:hypothetical protein